MNLVNEIGNDVARAFLIDKKCGDGIDRSRIREIIDAIRLTLNDRKIRQVPSADSKRTIAAKASQ